MATFTTRSSNLNDLFRRSRDIAITQGWGSALHDKFTPGIIFKACEIKVKSLKKAFLTTWGKKFD